MTSKSVLLSPGGNYTFSRYAKYYFMINSIVEASADWDVTAHIKAWSRAEPDYENLRVDRVSGGTTAMYNHRCFAKQRRECANHTILHHLDFGPRSYNPVIAAGANCGTQICIGPIEPPHLVDPYTMSNLVSKYLRWSPSPQIIKMFDNQITVLREKLYDPVRDWAMEQTLKQADVVIAVNDATASLLAETVDASKIETAHYGVDASRFTPGDPAQSRDIVAIGNLYPRKGFQTLLQAWPSVSSNHPDSQLHIIGDGPLRAQLIEMTAELEIAESVNIHGFVARSKLTDLLTNCRAFVHPTYSEGFPHVRLEAMASGTPVIGTNILGAQEMIRDGREGVIVDIGAADQLSAEMTHLLEHPKTATEMGERARKRAVSEYEWGQFGSKIRNIYDRLSN